MSDEEMETRGPKLRMYCVCNFVNTKEKEVVGVSGNRYLLDTNAIII